MNSEKRTKLCRHCKTEIPKDAKVCPNCRKKQSGIKKWIIIAVIAVLVIGIAGSGGDDDADEAVSGSQTVNDTDKAVSDNQTAEDDKAQDDRSEAGNEQKNDGDNKEQEDKGKGNGKKEQDAEEDNAEEDNAEQDNDKERIYAVGDIVETSVLKISYLSAEEYTSDNEFSQPEDGHIYYKMEFEFENISDTDQNVSSFNFSCYADGYDMQQAWLEGFDLDATISSGKKTKGSVVFEVPADSKEIILEYETDIWTQDKIVFAVK